MIFKHHLTGRDLYQREVNLDAGQHPLEPRAHPLQRLVSGDADPVHVQQQRREEVGIDKGAASACTWLGSLAH